MNKKNYILIVIIGFGSLLQLQSCKDQVIETFSSGNYLYFEREIVVNNKKTRIDTLDVSFSHYVGQETVTLPFTLKLIGDVLTEDKEYAVKVVEEKTTAKVGQYSIPEKPLFRKGVYIDTLYVTIYRDKMAADEEEVLTLSLVENENFGLGYLTYENVKLRFNSKIVAPKWWNAEITRDYYGVYSYKKLKTIIDANPGFVTIDGMSNSEKRDIAINTKNYIIKNGVTEEDGSEMKIPMY